ncbi:MAG: hypothetical protein ABSA51_11355 [Anaerolineaceae bacterium]|jgi:hypothetical protein
MYTRRPGCLGGCGEFLLFGWLFNWLQSAFGYRSGSCMGCGCGFILMIIFLMILMSILFGTDWGRLVMIPAGLPLI